MVAGHSTEPAVAPTLAMAMNDPAQVEVAAVILFDGPRMLVNRRPEGSYFGGWWEWPGGKLEQGETPEQCARRELMEEIGLEAGPLRVFDQRTATYPDRVVHLHFLVGPVKPGSSPRPDALEHQWLTPAEVKQLRFLEPNLPVLQRLIDQPFPAV